MMITIRAWGETALMWLKAAPKGIKNVKRAPEKEKQPGGKKGRNNIIDSSKLLEVQMWEYCNREGIGLAEIVQYFGIVFRKRLRNLGRKEERKRRKCNQRISIIKKTKVFPHKYIIEGTRKGLEMGVVPGRVWNGNSLGLPLSQELALRRQLASAAGNKLAGKVERRNEGSLREAGEERHFLEGNQRTNWRCLP